MRKKSLELTEVQKGIYFDSQVENSASYNISAVISMNNIQEEYFEKAFKLLVAEQEALRSSINIKNNLPVLIIHKQIDFELIKQDISNDCDNKNEKTKNIIKEEIKKTFDLSKPPLFRARLIKTDINEYNFLICIHHIISDGLSLEIFKKKLLSYYNKLLNKKDIELYQDNGFSKFIKQVNKKLKNGKMNKQKKFWIKKMEGIEPLTLQSDYSEKHKELSIGREKRFEISQEMTAKINNLAADQEVTVFIFFLAAFSVLMNQYTQRDDIVIASPFTYRPDLDFEETIGCFVSMLPMCFNIEKRKSFSTILNQTAKELFDVYKNIGYPGNLIMRDSNLMPTPGEPSIFDVSFVYDIYENTEEYGVKTKIKNQDFVAFPGSLMVVLNKTPEKDLIKIQYKANIFSEKTIDLLGRRFLKLINILVDNVDIKIENINLLMEAERENILNKFNNTSYIPYHPQAIIDIFNSKVEKHPDRIALIEGEKTKTYAEVNSKANQLAGKIMAFKKRDNEAVGIHLDRSIDMVISILAILKAGCAYVPISSIYPVSRKKYIFEDAEINLLISSSNLPYDKKWDVEILFVDEPGTFTGDDNNLSAAHDPFSLAYIMYTSGSTGRPKGVMIENHSLVNTLLDLERRFPLGREDVYLFKTAYTFDVSATEIFGWFIGEGSLLILESGGERNNQLILDKIEEHNVTHINFVPSMFRPFLELCDIKANVKKMNSLKWIFVGGEAVTSDIVKKFNSLKSNINLENVYGPTECTIWASNYSLREYNINNTKKSIPIGKPLNEIRWYIVGEDNKLQPIGIPGELCLSGAGLARGYLNREDLTEEKFVSNPFYEEGVDPEYYNTMYRTGDLARWRYDGTIEFLGRIDFQVKVRGIRMELGEIENVLAEHERIIQAVVVVNKRKEKSSVLCAYYISDSEISVVELKEHLSKSLPSYMIPSFFIHRTDLPLNDSGKINRKKLENDDSYLDNIVSKIQVPRTGLEKKIALIWKEVLAVPEVGIDDNFFEIGGTSLSLIQAYNKLRKVLNQKFSITLLFQLPTIRMLADYFSHHKKTIIKNRKKYFQRSNEINNNDIAVIGLSIHVPGAQNPYDFWNSIKRGKENIHFYSDDELENLNICPEIFNSANYVKAKGRVRGIDCFDHQFFNYTPNEVNMMSPQLRLLYKGTWEAFEDAGYFPGTDSAKTGIFIAASDDFEWYKKTIYTKAPYNSKYQAFTLSTNHFLATRLAYKFNIKGPAFSALTGCSSTLVTPHLACKSLILGECDLALAGGITVELPNEGGYFYEEGMMFSPDGHCRPFDAEAKGTVFSNGMALFIMKRLDEALNDNDNIYAVIKGSAVNNDGSQKVAFTAPSVEGQAEVIREAYRAAGIDPETVSYIEAHGTGTSLGDPVEVESLSKAFSTNKKQFCILGSVKGNVGHTDTAAGAVSLAKVLLSLKYKYLPGTVNYHKPNPKINFKDTPFIVNSKGKAWERKNTKNGILRAGINSFGVGGTNAHMVLEEAPDVENSSSPDRVNLLPFSAKSINSLNKTSTKVLEHLLKYKDLNISDAAWSLQVGRKPFLYRKYLLVNEDSFDETKKMIQKLNKANVYEVKTKRKDIYFMFSGQGSQYAGMGRDLYYSADKSGVSRIFKKYIDLMFNQLPEGERLEFLELIYGDKDKKKINQTEYAQFAIFALGFALGKTLIELGIKVAGMTGHSIGEITAAAVAGVFELKDAVEIVRSRGRIMQKQKSGAMLVVAAPAFEVEKELGSDVWLALDNTSSSCVVGGSEKDVAEFAKKAEKLGWQTAAVRTSHAFHTPMMKKAAEEFRAKIASYKMHEPEIPIVSNVSGSWVKEKEMLKAEYWAEHIINPVNFTKSLEKLLKNKEDILIEVGAGHILSTLLRQHELHAGQKCFNLVRHPKKIEDDVVYLNKKLGELWCQGIEIDWNVLKGDLVRRRISLPTYEFEKERFPIDIQQNEDSTITMKQNTKGFIGTTAQEKSSENFTEEQSIYEKQSSLETTVIKAYKTVFGFERVGIDQDFFNLGGDSLKAISLSAAVESLTGVKVEISDLFTYSTPETLAEYLSEKLNKNHKNTKENNLIRPVQKRNYYPLSAAQRRMYALYLLDKDNLAYNLPSATIIKGKLNKERFEKALVKLTKLHEPLRTSFEMRDEEVVQIIHENVKVPVTYLKKEALNDGKINQLIYDFIEAFDLGKAPLYRVKLIKLEENRHLLLFDFHHIITDGTSVEIITRDFNKLYAGELKSPEIQYKDFAVWQNNYLKSEEIKQQKNYWLEEFSGKLPVLQLPTDFDRSPVKDFEGSRIYFNIQRELTEKLKKLTQETETTLFMLLLSAWNVLLARYSSQEDIIVGTPAAGRTREEIKETVGMFVNMLAMRNHPEGKKRFIDFLTEVKNNSLGAFSNQDYQFDELVEQLNLERELNRNALFDVCFDFQNMEFHELEIEGLTFTPYQFKTQTSAYDLVMTCEENKKEQNIEGFIEYAAGLFKKETVERMVENFRMILIDIINNKEILIENITLLPQAEKQLLLDKFNNTELPVKESLLIQDMFEENVKRHPEKTALITADGNKISYQKLNERANILAWHLIDLGIEEESLVGIMSHRDENLFIALLGVLKAGGAYVPIDPAFPAERISYMLSECNINVLIADSEYQNNIAFEGTIINCSSLTDYKNKTINPSQGISKNNLACVIFTSGSTGNPKGVMIEQKSLVNFICDIKARGIFENENDRVICITTISFDIFGFESITPLCTGNSIYLADEKEQLDPALAGRKIIDNKVTHILSTVSRIKAFVENPEFKNALKQLKCILSGGENYPLQLLEYLQKRTQAKIYNMYGPTETTIWSTTKDLTDCNTINIGQPITNTRVYITNPAGKLQPIGVFGELCLAGEGLARGYLNNIEETKKKFVKYQSIPEKVVYRTGDRARILDNGEIELLGRLDSQVKVRGYRVELNEIEKVVQGHKAISRAVAKVFDDKKGNKQLVLYYCLKREAKPSTIDNRQLKSWLKDRLPHYMIPSYFKLLEEMPVLANGKIDKKALPLPEEKANLKNRQVVSPATELEKELLSAWKEVCSTEEIGVRDNFFDVGGNSLGLILVNNKLNKLIGQSVPLTQLFENPTIESLVNSLDISKDKIERKTSAVIDTAKKTETTDIAVIGMACKFPGANNISSFWENIVSGVESIAVFNDEELKKAGIAPETLSNADYVKAKGFLEGVEYFDPDFFDYSYQEANMMDPQIRILHQCAWEVLENGGYDPSSYAGQIGLFAGSGSNIPWITRFLGKEDELINNFEAMTLNEKDFLTTRISYKLDLKGPSFNIQTACSTSLVAIHEAVQALLREEAAMAIAGGVSISYPRKEGYLWHEGMIYSKDGHCRPFAEDSSGTVSGNGCGVVLLKPFSSALQDGDNIYAVIKGSAINNDGIEKVGYTAPSITGQRSVIKDALVKSGISAEEINYLEAHGTGTKMGDPVELEALKQAWATDKKQYCAIGSVKANIGHLDAAAGVAGFIKAVLTLYNRTLPPLINYKKPNSRINFESSPFYINKRAEPIKDSSKLLRAGVSSFGIGGTNAHLILEQPPAVQKRSLFDAVNLLVFSGRSQTALKNTSQVVLEYIINNPNLNISDIAWTLQERRKAFEIRKALVVDKVAADEDNFKIQKFINDTGNKITEKKDLYFMFSGQSSQYSGIGHDLYYSAEKSGVSRIFKKHIDLIINQLEEKERLEFLELMYGDKDQGKTNQTKHIPFAIFAVGYALGKTLIELGIKVAGMIGYSMGEITAAAVAGVFELKDAVEIAKNRCRIMQEQKSRDVLAVESSAFHTPMMKKAAEEFGEKIVSYKIHEPEIPLVSNVSGTWIKEKEMKRAEYWTKHILKPLNFRESLKDLLKKKEDILIELGAGHRLSRLVKQHKSYAGQKCFNLMHSPEGEEDDVVYLNKKLGQLWCQGIEIDWNVLKGDSERRHIPLPTYVFDKKYHENDVIVNDYNTDINIKDSINKEKVEDDNFDKRPDEISREKLGEHLSKIWHKLLGCDEIGTEDDFFVLGGHSLKAISLAAQIKKEFNIEITLTEIFNNSIFSQMIDYLYDNTGKKEFQKITLVKKKSFYQASSAQKRMYAVHEVIDKALSYNLASTYFVKGVVDKEKFKNTIDKLLQRHESFRTRFSIINGEVVQIIDDEVDSIVEFGTSTESHIDDEIEKYIRPFDLSKAPLLRVKLISLSDKKHVLIIDMHHIIADQSSIDILLKEIKDLYTGKSLPPQTIQYKDFAAWQNEFLNSSDIEKQFEYWENEFKGRIPRLNMITDYNRPQMQVFEGDCIKYDLGDKLSSKINKFAEKFNLTPYMIFMAALKLLLWKATGQNDLVIGTAVAGRRHPDLDSVVGMFVNTLAVRSKIDEELTVDEYLQYIKEKMLKSYENQDCQFEMLIERLNIEKDLSRNPLFDVVINYINMGTEELTLEGLSLEPRPEKKINSKFDMTWTIEERNGRYFTDIEYAASLFKPETIRSYGKRLLKIISLIIEKPEQKLTELSLVTEKEEKWLLHEINQTTTDYPGDKTIIELFEEHVKVNGYNTAVMWKDEEISYLELNNRANKFAEALIQKNLKHGDKTAILMERSPLQIVSILGILKAGCVYVPIDPEYPEERINFMLEDSGSALLVTNSQHLSKVHKKISYILLDREAKLFNTKTKTTIPFKHQPKEASSDDSAYIMYTSGSTGTPKGVVVSHRNVIRVVKKTNYINILAADRLLQLSNYAFDGSVFDIFGAFLNGACLVMISKENTIEVPKLAEFIKEKNITVFFITAALFNMLVDWDVSCLQNVRKIIFGGETASVYHVRKALDFLGPNRLINGYGPTETTVFASYYPINQIDDNARFIPIGNALSNTKLYILDKYGNPVPPNVPGELYIGGDGVCKGYLNREELTKQKFLENKFDKKGKLYRTGDLVLRLPAGEIVFIERLDFQIKIRGFRVELGEIENHINNIEGIKEAITVAKKDKSKNLYIAAYFTVDKNAEIKAGQVKEILNKKLPDYMLPSRLMKMEKLPLNLNGKIDRKALPVIEKTRDNHSNYLKPRNKLEEMILREMREVLDNNEIGVKDNFFESGGQSIKAIALVQVLIKKGIKIKVNEIFQYPTVEKLAALPQFKDSLINDTKVKHTVPDIAEEYNHKKACSLNEHQIDSLIDHVMNTSSLISRMVVLAERISQFPLSPVQKAHNTFGAYRSGFTTKIKASIDENSMRKILLKIIKDNQLLHCVVEQDNKKIWNEYDISKLLLLLSRNIPLVDLREYNHKTQELIIEKMCFNILLSPYQNGYLPWRLCCLRLSSKKYFIIWGFDHTAFDGMSAEIIRHQIEKEINFLENEKDAQELKHTNSPQKYEDYVSLIDKGPQDINEEEIINLFSLKSWKKSNNLFMDRINKITNKSKKEANINIPLKNINNQNLWWFTYDFIVKLLSEYTGLDEIPFAVVDYGRSYSDMDFYNCIGEFLDIIPILAGKNKTGVLELLEKCRHNSINFLALLFSEKLTHKFSEIGRLLMPVYKNKKQPQKLALFNFQGFISKKEKKAFQNLSKESGDNNLAQAVITANYDQENLNINLNCFAGINLKKIKKIISLYSDKYSGIFVGYQTKEVKDG